VVNVRIPLESAQTELEVRKSKFLAFALPCTSLTDAKHMVSTLKAEHPGANHVVHAAVIGERGDEFSYSDDREPKNTAGRPALEVLKGSGITNVAIFIVRYFGGTLLGTGGLVKAYGESAKKVLEILKTLGGWLWRLHAPPLCSLLPKRCHRGCGRQRVCYGHPRRQQ
jgi:uncharacterized YigZ family protein